MQRRSFLGCGAAALAAPALGHTAPPPAARPAKHAYQGGRSPWPISLDTATIRPATLLDKIKFASRAGFDAIEPWDGEIAEFESSGGSLADLRARIKDAGLFVPSVIGLWNAIPPTREEFDASLTDSRRRMQQAAAIGAEHIQVVPQPERPWQKFDPFWSAARYRELLEIGLSDYGINPAMVFVKFLEGARTLGQAAQIALDADHPKAKIIPDVFHMHIGGSGFSGLRHIRGDFIAIVQFNDAPAEPPREELEDKHRVYPGDGVLPLTQCLRDLSEIGFRGCISLELYNPAYWEADPATVARIGLEKTLATIVDAGV